MNDTAHTTYAYLRVSTDRQDLDNQRHGILEYAKQKELEPLKFAEDTVSGTKDWSEREIGRLLKEAKPGDIILTAEFSRLGRSALQVMLVLEEAAKRQIAIHIVKNQLIMDGSLNARMMALAFGMAAEIERDFISKRTTEALSRRKAEGKPIGRKKGSTNENKKLDQHADQIKEWLAKGIGKTSIAKMLDCVPLTLYTWMYANSLESYIKSRQKNEKPAPAPAPAAMPLVPTRARRGGKPKATGTGPRSARA